jgi:hypothetical protein
MTIHLVEKVADALLYEGYMLYPYRPSAVKNRQRFNFGVVYPKSPETSATEGEDAHVMRTECLLKGSSLTTVHIRVRFLQMVQRTLGAVANFSVDAKNATTEDFTPVDILSVDGRTLQPWQEALERSIVVSDTPIADLASGARVVPFAFPAGDQLEPVLDASGSMAGAIFRHQETINAEIELSAVELEADLYRLRVQVSNTTASDEADSSDRDELLLSSLVSAHTILSTTNGSFVSLLDPPHEYRVFAAECHGVRTWPVLVGDAGQEDTMLSSPIMIYDYPLIAPESPGDLFDGTEIDEILSLRILTMTDEEKREMRDSDERARRLLDRTEALDAEQMMRMHGIMRELGPREARSA